MIQDIRSDSLELHVPAVEPRRVYVYWAQGFDQAPAIVQLCAREMRRHHGDDLVMLDDSNLDHYIALPDVGRTLSKTQYSDLVRLAILIRFGGIWLDATCLCTTNLLGSFNPGKPFLYSTFGRKARICSWMISSPQSSYLIRLLYSALLRCWRVGDLKLGYFAIHHLFEALYFIDTEFRTAWDNSDTIHRTQPHLLQRRFGTQISAAEFDELLASSPVHKLTYKYDASLPGEADEVLAMLFQRFPPEPLTAPSSVQA
jgi:hypothetical protein